MNFRKFVKNLNFLELGEFPIRKKVRFDASWSPVCVVQIWSESVKGRVLFWPKNRNPDCPQGNRYYIGSLQKDAKRSRCSETFTPLHSAYSESVRRGPAGPPPVRGGRPKRRRSTGRRLRPLLASGLPLRATSRHYGPFPAF